MNTDLSDAVMEAIEIDEEGNWVTNGVKIPLVGSVIPIPSDVVSVTGGDSEQEIIMMVEAGHYLSQCPSCEGKIPDSTIILLTEHAKMMPVHCCNTIIWMKEKREGDKYGTQS